MWCRVLLAVGLVTGCGRLGFNGTADSDASMLDGSSGDTATDAPPLGPFTGCVPDETDCGWTRRTRIQVSAIGNNEALTGVPIPIALDNTRFDFDASRSDGSDIRVANDADTEQLAFEIEAYTDGRALLWVRIPTLEPGEQGAAFLLYYGNPDAAAATPARVWDDDYVGVWHLGEASSAPNLDSSGSQNHAMPVGQVQPAQGIVAVASEFSGTSFSNAGNDDSLALTTAGTISAWVRFNSLTMFAAPIAKSEFGAAGEYSYGFRRNGEATGEMGLVLSRGAQELEAITEEPDILLGEWYHFAGRWDGTTVQMFLDGEPSGTGVAQTFDPQVVAAHQVTIGCGYAPDCSSLGGVDGLIDEARISRIARSNDWISTQVRAMRGELTRFGDIEER